MSRSNLTAIGLIVLVCLGSVSYVVYRTWKAQHQRAVCYMGGTSLKEATEAYLLDCGQLPGTGAGAPATQHEGPLAEHRTAPPLTDLPPELATRAHRNWEGEYTLQTSTRLRIQGQKDLYVLIYASPDRQGNLCEFVMLDDQKRATFLLEDVGNLKGVTPILEGIDVFPGTPSAEIILRWRHPGQGGNRTVQKYAYNSQHMELQDEAEFLGHSLGMQWRRMVQ